MASRRAVTALLFVQLIALAASAQQSAEFGRGTGGEIVLTPKSSSTFSGSIELSTSTGNDLLGLGSSTAIGLTAGGNLLRDRLWFFAAASRSETGARVQGQIAETHDFSAFFEDARRPRAAASVPSAFAGIAPSSFLSLRYTGVVSSNMFFNMSVTRTNVPRPRNVLIE